MKTMIVEKTKEKKAILNKKEIPNPHNLLHKNKHILHKKRTVRDKEIIKKILLQYQKENKGPIDFWKLCELSEFEYNHFELVLRLLLQDPKNGIAWNSNGKLEYTI